MKLQISENIRRLRQEKGMTQISLAQVFDVSVDEPTASFDAKAEAELYAQFFRTSAEKTVIFISHRLAASKAADRIAVFADGAVAEYGTHDS